MTDHDKNQPSAWVWSQYRSELPPAETTPRQGHAQPASEPTGREHPPLVPQTSGAGVGPALGLLILVAAGMTWWFSGAQPAKEGAPQETAAPAAETSPTAAEPKAAEPTPAAAAPEAKPAEEAKPEPKAEAPKAKKKKKQR